MEYPNNRYFEFDADGFPTPVGANVVTKQTLSRLLPAAMATRYEPMKRRCKDEEGKWQDSEVILESELRFQNSDGTWMTKAEVGAIRLAEAFSHGDEKATNQILDRVMGKPKQEVDMVTTKLTFMDWLKHRQQLAAEQKKDSNRLTTDPSPAPQQASIPANTIPEPSITDAVIKDDCSWL